MKIMYFLSHPGGVGGATKVVVKYAKIIQSLGHDVLMVIQDNCEGKHDVSLDDLCEGLCLPSIDIVYDIATCPEEVDVVSCLDSYERIKRIIMDYSPDFIHYVQINPTVEIVSRELRIPHLMSIFPISEDSFYPNWMNVFSQHICVDSEFYGLRWAEGTKAEVRIIRPPYERSNIINDCCKRKPFPHFLCIGWIVPYKRQLEVLKMLRAEKENGREIFVTFLGYGEESYLRECKSFVVDEKLEENVDFAGFTNHVDDFICNSDALIHASRIESFPGVIVEAMANRVPVITTPAGGITELIKNDKTGFVADGYSFENLAIATERFFTAKEENRLEDITSRAYDIYINNCSFSCVGNKMMNYYEDIISDQNNINEEQEVLLQKIKDVAASFPVENLSSMSKKKVWYLYYLQEIIQNSNIRDLFIWGAGKNGKIALEWAKLLGLTVEGFFDINKTGDFEGYPIEYPSDESIKEKNVILISIGNMEIGKQIKDRLDALGKVRNRDYFFMVNNPFF